MLLYMKKILSIFKSLLTKSFFQGKFAKDMIWSISATVIVGLSSLLIQTLIGAYYNAAAIGLYALIFAYYIFLTALANFGIEVSILKHVAEFSSDKEKLCSLYTSAQMLTIATSLIVVLLTYFTIVSYSIVFSSQDVANGLLYFLPAIVFFSLNKNSNNFDCGLRRIKLYSIVRAFRWSAIVSMVFCILFFDYEYNYIFMTFSLVELLILFYFIVSHWKYIIKVKDYSWFKVHFKYGYTTVLGSIIGVLTSHLLILISGYYLSKSETGIISFIVTFSIVFSLITSSIQINYNPIFAKEWARRNLDKINEDVRKIFKIILPASLPVLIGVIALYYCYTIFFMPIEFKATLGLFVVVAIGTGINLIFSWPAPMVIMSGKVYENLVRNGLIFTANILLSFTFIKFFGLNGVAFVSLLFPLVSIYINFYIIKKYLGISILNIIIKSLKSNL